jgi:hypothetical protein
LLSINNEDGEVNYVITKIMKGVYSRQKYAIYNRAIGVLTSVLLEFYRVIVAPYEDKKKEEHGDVKIKNKLS